MDDETTTMLRATVEHLVATTAGADLTGALLDLGWAEMVADDGPAATAVLFEALGAAPAASSALDGVVLGAVGLDPVSTRVLYPDPLGGAATGLALGGAWPDAGAVVVLGAEDTLGTARAEGAAVTPVAGIDPDLGLLRVTLAGPAEGTVSGADPAAAWAAGRRALAHEIIGASQAMMVLAQEHVAERHQFGRPIGTFQAVRHRLADAHVALSAARAATAEAGRSGTAADARMAKALAGRAATVVAGAALQVTGGMGFTWEHPLHRYLRRTMALNVLLGSADVLAAGFGRAILDGGAVPRLGTI